MRARSADRNAEGNCLDPASVSCRLTGACCRGRNGLVSRSNASRPIAPEKQVLGRLGRLTYSTQLVEDRFCQHLAIAPEWRNSENGFHRTTSSSPLYGWPT